VRMAPAQLGPFSSHPFYVSGEIVDARKALRHTRRRRKAARPCDGLRKGEWGERLWLATKAERMQKRFLLQEECFFLAVARFHY
jgi:hypothetical protein